MNCGCNMKNKISKYFQQNREQKIFCLTLIFGLFLCLGLGGYFLLASKENFYQAENTLRRLQMVRAFGNSHRDYENFFATEEQKFAELTGKLDRKMEFDNLAEILNNYAAMHSVQIEDLTFLPTKNKEKNYLVQNVQIVASGFCQDLLDFMKDIENAENLMLFSDLLLEHQENNQIKLTGKIKSFCKK